jgi:endonuclease I
LIIRSENATPSAAPVDGVTYTVGQSIGNAKVIGIGSTLNYVLKSLRAQKTYHFAVYAYVNSGAINYRQDAPLVSSFTTPASMVGNYYNGISDTTMTFIDDLKNRIRNPYINNDYGLYDENLVAEFEATDTINGQKNVTCVYSGFKYTYTPPFVWYTTSPFSREHTWAVSWMPSGGSTSSNEYEDYHHLFTVVQNNANAVRSNYPFGDVVSPTSVYLDGQLGFNAAGQRVYEPRDDQIGNTARALFYMALRYDDLNGADWSFDYLNNNDLIPSGLDPQSVETLLEWHIQDAPDAYEISRNDYIQSKQGNRNPFIDHPNWVNAIDFYQLTLKNTKSTTAPIAEETKPQAKVYPNPTAQLLHVSFADQFDYRIFDLTGKEMLHGHHEGAEIATLEVNQLASGTYILVLEDGNNLIYNRFVRE